MVKVIFLDMGGVIVKEAGKDQISLLAQHSGLSFDKCKNIRKKYWNSLKLGEITDEEYWLGTDKVSSLKKGLLEDLGITKEKYLSLRKDSIDFITPLKNSQEFLQKLSRRFFLVLVSNNSYDWGENVLKKLDYQKHFQILIFSHNVGYSKPRKEIFEIAITKVRKKIQNNNEILFIDDKEKNFLIPKQIGIRTHLFKNYEDIYSLLKIE
jgi:FMN phosphatase YigB (HAD superfamily)